MYSPTNLCGLEHSRIILMEEEHPSVTALIQAQAANESQLQWFNTEHNVNAAWNA